MTQQACQERATGRIGLIVGDSNRDLEVVFSPGGEIEILKANSVIKVDLRSLTFIRISDPAFLQKLLSEDMASAIKMVILGMDSWDATTVNIKKKFANQTAASDAVVAKLAKFIEGSVKSGELIGQNEGGKKTYAVVGEFSPLVPEQFEWMVGYEANTKVPPKSKSKPEAHSPAEVFIKKLAHGDEESTPEYTVWLADPVAASLDLARLLIEGRGQVKIKKVSPSEINVFCLCPSQLWLDGSAEEKRLLNKHLVKIIGSHSNAVLKLRDSAQSQKESALVLENLNSRIQLLDSPAIETRSPFELFHALIAIRQVSDGEPAVASGILKKILADKSIDKSVREQRKAPGNEDVEKVISTAVSSTPWGELREALSARAIKFWKVRPESLDIFEGASMTNLTRLLESLDEGSRSDVALMRQAANRMDQLLEFNAGVGSAALILGLITKFKLELSPKKVANYMASALGKDERLKPLAKTISGETVLAEVAAELSELKTAKTRLEANVLDASHTISEQSKELEVLRAKLLTSRKETETGLDQSDTQSKLPVLKLLARTLSAAEEFLADNPGALARLEILADQASLVRMGNPGDVVEFNPLLHQDPEGQLEPGQEAQIYIVGYSWKNAGVELVLQKALVQKRL